MERNPAQMEGAQELKEMTIKERRVRVPDAYAWFGDLHSDACAYLTRTRDTRRRPSKRTRDMRHMQKTEKTLIAIINSDLNLNIMGKYISLDIIF